MFSRVKWGDSGGGLGFEKGDREDREKSGCSGEGGGWVFGDRGFRGSCVWVDGDNEVIFVLLSKGRYGCVYEGNNVVGYNMGSGMEEVMYEGMLD